MNLYRFASTLGERYATPIFFSYLPVARQWAARHQQLVGDLPGADTMRIEYLDSSGEWLPVDGGDQ